MPKEGISTMQGAMQCHQNSRSRSDRKGSAFSKGLCDNYVDDGLERGKLAREANWKPLLCYKREAKTEVL